MTIEIKKGIPIPTEKRKWRKYPFDQMEVGDMFELEYDRIVHQAIYGAIRNFRIKHYSYRFKIITSKDENYIKIWRIQ